MIIGIMLGIGNGAVFKMVPEVSPDHIGSVTGIVGAVGGIGGFFPAHYHWIHERCNG